LDCRNVVRDAPELPTGDLFSTLSNLKGVAPFSR
jgi:hypothetical protein